MAMDPMAAQGGAPAPEGAAPAEGGGDQLGDLISNLTDGFAMLTDVLGSANPAAGEKMMALSESFKGIIEEAMNGGAAPGGAGAVAPEVGGAKARPASPAGIARG